MTSVFFRVTYPLIKSKSSRQVIWWHHHIDTVDLWTGQLPVVMPIQMAMHNASIFNVGYFKTDLQIVQVTLLFVWSRMKYLHTCNRCLSYWLFLTFLLKKLHLSPAKKCNSPSVCYENKSPWPSALRTETSGNFPQETSLHPREWQSQTVSCLLIVIMYNYII